MTDVKFKNEGLRSMDEHVFGKWRLIHRDVNRVVGFHVLPDGRGHPVVAIVEKGTKTQMVPRPEARREWAHLRVLGFRLISPQDREYMEDFGCEHQAWIQWQSARAGRL